MIKSGYIASRIHVATFPAKNIFGKRSTHPDSHRFCVRIVWSFLELKTTLKRFYFHLILATQKNDNIDILVHRCWKRCGVVYFIYLVSPFTITHHIIRKAFNLGGSLVIELWAHSKLYFLYMNILV